MKEIWKKEGTCGHRHKDDESRAVNNSQAVRRGKETDGWTDRGKERDRECADTLNKIVKGQRLRWSGSIREQADTQKYVINQPAL